VHNGKIKDLVADTSYAQHPAAVAGQQSARKGNQKNRLQSIKLVEFSAAQQLLEEISGQRRSAPTQLNDQSSRSHLIVSLVGERQQCSHRQWPAQSEASIG
jgi:hypothetical protein